MRGIALFPSVVIALLICIASDPAHPQPPKIPGQNFPGETVFVRGRGSVSLDGMFCSTLAEDRNLRICYDDYEHYMLVLIDGAYEQLCGINEAMFAYLMSVRSIRQTFNRAMRGRYPCPKVGSPG